MQPGIEQRQITLTFEGGRTLQLVLRAMVEADYSTPARRLMFDFNSPGESSTEEFVVNSYFSADRPQVAVAPEGTDWLSITSVTEISTTNSDPTPVPIARWRVSVRCIAPRPGDQASAYVTIELPKVSTSEKLRQLRIPVLRRLRNAFQIYPKILVLRPDAEPLKNRWDTVQIDLVAAEPTRSPTNGIEAVFGSLGGNVQETRCTLVRQNGRVATLSLSVPSDLQSHEGTYLELRDAETHTPIGRVPVVISRPLD
jgi:hypothetical protein